MLHAGAVHLGERYYQLSRLGRETFCASVAQATLVRVVPAFPPEAADLALGTGSGIADLSATQATTGRDATHPGIEEPRASATMSADSDLSTLLASSSFSRAPETLQEFTPLVKKLGTPFVDLITIGRTEGNDITITDLSVSRFQAFFRRRHGRWFVCDAGSSNGTRVNGKKLLPRTEAEVSSHTTLRFGAVEFCFHTADSLYDVLASRHMASSDADSASEWL